jgi:hypothetical protein
MAGAPTIFDTIKLILFWTSPLLLLLGIIVLFSPSAKYAKLENILGRKMGGITKIVVPALETDIYTFHNWLLKKRIIVSLVFIICSIAFFIVSKI